MNESMLGGGASSSAAAAAAAAAAAPGPAMPVPPPAQRRNRSRPAPPPLLTDDLPDDLMALPPFPHAPPPRIPFPLGHGLDHHPFDLEQPFERERERDRNAGGGAAAGANNKDKPIKKRNIKKQNKDEPIRVNWAKMDHMYYQKLLVLDPASGGASAASAAAADVNGTAEQRFLVNTNLGGGGRKGQGLPTKEDFEGTIRFLQETSPMPDVKEFANPHYEDAQNALRPFQQVGGGG
ncbi:unnamed protein product [Vitrella brassicaformis CCMP3155]|uniref:Uncharacterized protein n=1 Tax=Vitrella brassicaformis (strain CCMP3155) TaxID=1169540 RepID=A0A0G4GKX7_VITBC|nr:unnamed protein product [Vitrella brassicaformis CCMP3155]|eukprot:CEM30675.1 unnamed protein product [Vitrella brassicaformis CCMP3155]